MPGRGAASDPELAHRLRTPLTALKSAIDILCSAELPESQRRFAGIARRNVDQMILLVEELLAGAPVRS
jgi:signal transduction histidine kinase